MEGPETDYQWELINDICANAARNPASPFVPDSDTVFLLHHAYAFRPGQALRYAFHCCSGDYMACLDAGSESFYITLRPTEKSDEP